MKKLIVTILGLGLALGVAVWSSAQSSQYKVIVHPDNPTTDLSARDVSNYFRKKSTRWEVDGFARAVQPIDLLPNSAVRETFTREVLRKSVSSIESYWQNEVFSGGKTPPPKAQSDAEVINFVRNNPGAIGYVSAGAQLRDVKEINISG